MQTFHLYTHVDLEATENQWMVNAAFVAQAQGDIWHELQKLGGFTGVNARQLLEVAIKVFVNWDQEAWWESEEQMKNKGRSACWPPSGSIRTLPERCSTKLGPRSEEEPTRGTSSPRDELECNEWAYFCQEGYWKNECPTGQKITQLLDRGREARWFKDSTNQCSYH